MINKSIFKHKHQKKFLKNRLPPTKVGGLTDDFSDSEFFRLFGKTPPKGGGFQLSENNKISEKELYRAYKLFFNTFSSEQRLRILNLLRNKSMNVSEIQKAVGFEQSVVSHNLKRLKKCSFIESEIRGKFRYYKVNDKTIKNILDLIDRHMKSHCIHIIRGMKENEH